MKTHFRIFLALTAWLLTISAAAFGFDAKTEAERLLEAGGATASGTSAETGIWVIAVGESPISSAEAEERDFAQADLNARAALAEFFASELQTSAETEIREDSAGETSETFSSNTRAYSRSRLKGARIVRRFVRDGNAVAVALFTERTADAADALQRATANDDENSVSVVEAVGEGATPESAAEAACRNALMQVNGVSVTTSEASVDGGKLRSRTFAGLSGEVASFRVLSQTRRDDGTCVVRIVAEVSRETLQDGYETQMKSAGDPLFFLETENEDTRVLLSDWFLAKGLKTTVSPSNADYKVEVKTRFSDRTHPQDGRAGTQLRLSVDCFDKAGVRLFSLQGDPKKATVFIGDRERQRQLAVEKAVEQLDAPLHERLQRAVSDMTNNGRPVRIVFRNVRTPRQCGSIEALTDEINDMPGAAAAVYSLDSETGTATIRFSLKGNPQDFLSLLRERVPDIPPALSVTPNKIVFEL